LLLEAGSWGTGIDREPRERGTSAVGSRYQPTASRDCNRLRTLVCVWQWPVKCSHESCVYKWSINPISNRKPRRESL
jgi:hypothetical protein